jgi:hypothetical protein
MYTARSLLRNWLPIVGFILIAIFLILLSPSQIFAQTNNTTTMPTTDKYFNSSNIDSNVSRNTYNNVQITTIELMATLICQITGIDPINPRLPCLGINPDTNKIGYTPATTDSDGTPKVGGLIGTATDMISYTFQPIATTSIYTSYISDRFGIVPTTYASHGANCDVVKNGYGFCGLMPIFHLWEVVRNIAYALLVLALTFIGIGVMLRVKIDPRTVMTIQNQIPKVIISIILITFSYAISAILIDLLWTTTYAGVNLIVNSSEAVKEIKVGNGPESFAEKSSKQLLEIPLVYVNGIFHTSEDNGIYYLTKKTANFVGQLIEEITKSILGVDDDNKKCFRLPLSIDFGQCVGNALGFIATLAARLILFFVLVIALFKIWFNLLKAYVFTLLYVIISPVYIVFGLLPTKPLGFESWLRRFFANIAVFPLTAFILVGARVLASIYDTPDSPEFFIPPLIGHNAGSNFGALLALGAILIAPQIQTILREKLGVKQIGTPGIIAAGLASGAAVVGAPVGRAMKHLNDPRTGDVGALAKLKRRSGETALKGLTHAPIFSKHAEQALGTRMAIDKGGSAYKYTDKSGKTHSPADQAVADWKEQRRGKGEKRNAYKERLKKPKVSEPKITES